MDLESLVSTTHTLHHRVTTQDTAQALGSGGVEVLSTPILVALVEQAARDAVAPALPPSHTTVGSFVQIHHLAPTPVGWTVEVRVEVVAVQGRKLSFRAEARDQAGVVAQAQHERVVVDLAKFMDKVRLRTEGYPASPPP